MSTQGERLREYLESQHDNMTKFCEENEISQNSLSAVFNNKRPLGMEFFMKVKKAEPNMDANYILDGKALINIDKSHNGDLGTAEDPIENLFLTYLSKPKSIDIMKEQVREVLMQLGDGPEALHITPGDENSPLMDKLSKIAEQHTKKRDSK